jgi:hypothetical protein
MDLRFLATPLIIVGLFLIGAGLFFHFGGGLSFLGKLPGDIRVERPGFKFYFPAATCLLISIVLSAIFWFISKLR